MKAKSCKVIIPALATLALLPAAYAQNTYYNPPPVTSSTTDSGLTNPAGNTIYTPNTQPRTLGATPTTPNTPNTEIINPPGMNANAPLNTNTGGTSTGSIGTGAGSSGVSGAGAGTAGGSGAIR